jgi:hypothetical protein
VQVRAAASPLLWFCEKQFCDVVSIRMYSMCVRLCMCARLVSSRTVNFVDPVLACLLRAGPALYSIAFRY